LSHLHHLDLAQSNGYLDLMLADVHPFFQIFVPVVHSVDTDVLIPVILAAGDVGQPAGVPLNGDNAAELVVISQIDDDVPGHIPVFGASGAAAAVRVHEVQVVAAVDDAVDHIARPAFQ